MRLLDNIYFYEYFSGGSLIWNLPILASVPAVFPKPVFRLCFLNDSFASSIFLDSERVLGKNGSSPTADLMSYCHLVRRAAPAPHPPGDMGN